MIIYGFSIIIFGIKTKEFVHIYGRIREVTYVFVMFSPIMYGIIELNWKFLLAILLFFPVYYFFIEMIDRLTPNPKVYDLDEGKSGNSLSNSSFGSDLGSFDTGSNQKSHKF